MGARAQAAGHNENRQMRQVVERAVWNDLQAVAGPHWLAIFGGNRNLTVRTQPRCCAEHFERTDKIEFLNIRTREFRSSP